MTTRGSGDTSAVGCFPANGFGLHDMIGNVAEWTRSLWGENGDKPNFAYPYDPDDSNREDLNAGNDVLRVVRGGAWDDDRRLCPLRLPRQVSPPRPGRLHRFSGGVAVCPCSHSSDL